MVLGEQPLGPPEPLVTLADEFKYNPIYRESVEKLKLRGYSMWRRVRGDGNCFYRALGYALLEKLLQLTPEHRDRWVAMLRAKCSDVRLDDIAGHQQLLECMSRFETGEPSRQSPTDAVEGGEARTIEESVLRSLCDPSGFLDLAFVQVLRRVTARHLQDNRAQPIAEGNLEFETVCLAEGYSGVDEFNTQIVELMGKEAEGVALNALAAALDIGLRIACIDRAAPLYYCDYNFPSSAGDSGVLESAGVVDGFEKPIIHLQFRPGHYDIIS